MFIDIQKSLYVEIDRLSRVIIDVVIIVPAKEKLPENLRVVNYSFEQDLDCEVLGVETFLSMVVSHINNNKFSLLIKMLFARRAKPSATGRHIRRHLNRINNLSFVDEYYDTHYSSLGKQEFASLYENRLKGGNLWKGKATKEGTEMFSVKNSKSMIN